MLLEYTNAYCGEVDKEYILSNFQEEAIRELLRQFGEYAIKMNLAQFKEQEDGNLKMEIHVTPPEYWKTNYLTFDKD